MRHHGVKYGRRSNDLSSFQDILGIERLRLAACFLPMGVGGFCLAIAGGTIFHVVSGTNILLVSGLAIMIASLLLAKAPQNAGYWLWIFPSMVAQTISIELVFNMSNIFLSTSFQAQQQGLAGAFGQALVQFSMSIFLAVAAIVTRHTESQNLRKIYQKAFWFQFACGAMVF